MENRNELPLRLGVGIVLLNQKNEVFVGRRIDNPKNSWQMPQGGVDQNEDFLQAAKRELAEETGIKSIRLIKELDGWFKYDLPEYLLGKLWEGKYKGQKQKWFVMKFLGKPNEINVKHTYKSENSLKACENQAKGTETIAKESSRSPKIHLNST